MNSFLKPLAIAIAAVPAAVAASAAQASSLNYDGIALSYGRSSVEIPALENFDLDGYGVEAMYSLSPNLVIGGGYTSASGSTSAQIQGGGTLPLDVTGSGPTVFGFFHFPLMSNTDVFVGGTYSKIENEFKNGDRRVLELSGSSNSKGVIGGLRHQLMENVELGLVAEYDLDAEGDEDKISYSAVSRFRLDNALDMAVTFSPDKEGDEISISLKKYFGTGGR